MTVKRKDLKPGEEYWIQPRYKPGQLIAGTKAPYRKVHLVEVQSGNRALVQWDVLTYDPPVHPLMLSKSERDAQRVVTRTKMAIISVADFQYSEADRLLRGTVYDPRGRCLVLGPMPVGVDSLTGQGAVI